MLCLLWFNCRAWWTAFWGGEAFGPGIKSFAAFAYAFQLFLLSLPGGFSRSGQSPGAGLRESLEKALLRRLQAPSEARWAMKDCPIAGRNMAGGRKKAIFLRSGGFLPFSYWMVL
jgi:hypothetical protein